MYSILDNCIPMYNNLYNSIYDKITNFINTTNDTYDINDTNDNIGDNTYYYNNYDFNYFITTQLVLYYTLTIFMSIVFIKNTYYLNAIGNSMSISISNTGKDTDNNTDTNIDNVVGDTNTDNIVDDTNTDNETDTKDDDKKLYLHSLIEITQNNSEIMSKLKANTNYIVILRVKLQHYLQMKTTKYELHSKYTKYNSTNKDFITKDMYMIMGFNFNNQHTNFANIIVPFINHLNIISNEKYRNEDFLIVAIGSVNDNNDNNANGFANCIINIKYELFNLIDVVLNIKNNLYVKYTLTLPIININNMILDMFSETIFISRHYSIDKNNYEKWNGNLLNNIKEW